MIEIIKWSECFESADTRKRQRLGWFLSPSGCDSKGFRKLMRLGKDGILALGVFQALCQAMATQSIESRRAGMFKNSDGEPMELEDILEISRLSGMKVADNRQAIGRLVACGWVTLHKELNLEQNASDLPPICQSSPSFVQGEGEGEGKGEEEGHPPNPRGGNASALADEIWKLCPKFGRERSSQDQLIASLKKLPASALADSGKILESLAAWKLSESWTREDGRFVPGIHRWVKDGKWKLIPEPAKPSARKFAGMHEDIDLPMA